MTQLCRPCLRRYLGLKGLESYWAGDVEMALKPHPIVVSNAATPSGAFLEK